MPDFLLHFARLADRVGDFLTKEFSIAAAQAIYNPEATMSRDVTALEWDRQKWLVRLEAVRAGVSA